MLKFPSAAALDGYRADERRLPLVGERDMATARTQVMNLELV